MLRSGRLIVRIIAASTLFWMATLFAGNTPYPVSDYFRGLAFNDARLSPNGQLVLALNRVDKDHQYVELIDLRSQSSTDIIVTAGEAEHFGDLQWISNDTAIFIDYLGQSDRRLVSVQWLGFKDGKPQSHVTTWPQGDTLINPLSIQTDEVLIGRWEDYWYRVYKVNINAGPDQLKSGALMFSLKGNITHLMTEDNGNLRLKSTVDGDGTEHFFWQESGDSGWKEFKTVKEGQTFNPVAITADGEKLLVFSNVGRNTIGFFEYDPVAEKFIKTLFARDDADATNYYFDWNTDQVSILIWSSGGVLHYAVLDSHRRTLMPALEGAFPDQQVVPVDMSSNGQEVLIYTYSDVNPGAYYAVDLKAGKAELLGQHAPWFDENSLVPVRAGAIATPDGFSISYLLTLPQTGVKPYPLVVIPHGGPIGIFDVDGYDNEAQLLASRGYAVLKVNYRGSGGNGKKFENAGKQQWGRKIEDDIEEVVMSVLKTYPINGNRVCIYGASYGGYSALMSMIRYPDLYKCAATYAGVTDLPLLYDSSSIQFNRRVRDDMADIIGDPTTEAAELRSLSPVYLAAEISHPVLIGQGLKDRRVDPEQAYRLKLILDTLKKPYEFYTYKDEDHGFFKSEDATDFYTHLLAFLSKNIGPESASSRTSDQTDKQR